MNNNLLIKKLTGKLNFIEKIQFQRLLKNNPEFQQEYNRISKIWQQTSPPEITVPDKDRQWQLLSNRLGFENKLSVWQWKPAVAMAMTVLVLVIGLHVKNTYIGYEYYSTALGEKIEVTLPDGSEVSLNAESNLKFAKRFHGKERKVELAGEAYFEVQPNDKEFVVYTENARTRVLGTGFNLWARRHYTKLAVTHGQVGFNYKNSSKDADIILTKNQKAECRQDNSLTKIDSVDAGSVIKWQQGGLYFKETPLYEIIDEIHRQYDIQIHCEANVDTTATLTGSFADNTPEEILEAISISFGLELSKENGGFILKQK